jgi:hypothetical protein
MPGFTEVENRIIKKYISDIKLSASLALIRGAMEDIWATDAPRIVKDYTDHGEKHSETVAYFVEKLLQANPDTEFSEQEIYLLLAGVYLHDIGMQCDVVKYPEVKKGAERLGTKFDVEFTAETTHSYSLEQQTEIRKSHNFLSASWVNYLYTEADSVLSLAIKSIPNDLVDDLMDICKFHSKSSINDCPDSGRHKSSIRKKMVSALLRFADELDISSTRIGLDTLKNFNKNPERSVYWWLHNYTTVSFIGSNKVLLKIRLNPKDFELYGSFIFNESIIYFKNKNQPVLDVLIREGISIEIDNKSNVEQYKHANEFPHEITAIFDKMMQESSFCETSSNIHKMS